MSLSALAADQLVERIESTVPRDKFTVALGRDAYVVYLWHKRWRQSVPRDWHGAPVQVVVMKGGPKPCVA